MEGLIDDKILLTGNTFQKGRYNIHEIQWNSYHMLMLCMGCIIVVHVSDCACIVPRLHPKETPHIEQAV